MKIKHSSVSLVVYFGFLVLLSGCDQSNHSAEVQTPKWEQVAVDVSTPDKALRSYWNLRDAQNSNWLTFANDPYVKKLRSEMYGPYGEVVSPLIAKQKSNEWKADKDTFAREIIKIVFESESKAVITTEIRNNTPIAEMAYLSISDLAQRNNGDAYQYVLEKYGENWKISEVRMRSRYSDRERWDVEAPSSTLPRFPIYTYDGF